MKKITILFSIMAILFAHNYAAATPEGGDKVTKERKVSGRYNVHSGDKVQIENIYGKVHINTWDKNEVTVDVIITVGAGSESKAQELMDRIVVTGDADGGSVHYKTSLKSGSSNGNTNMSIDYTVNMPRKNPLDVTNKFGDVYLDDIDGKVDLEVGYGALTTHNITAPNAQIKVSFGSASIARIDKGKLDISYSKLSIEKAGDIDVKNMFGRSVLGTVENLQVNQRYGNLDINEVNRIEGNVDFADLAIDKLTKSIDMVLKYCGTADLRSIGPDVNLVKLTASFSTVKCTISPSANLNLDIKTSFGDVKDQLPRGAELTETGTGSNAHSYRGRIGRGDGSLAIEAKYGNVTLK